MQPALQQQQPPPQLQQQPPPPPQLRAAYVHPPDFLIPLLTRLPAHDASLPPPMDPDEIIAMLTGGAAPQAGAVGQQAGVKRARIV